MTTAHNFPDLDISPIDGLFDESTNTVQPSTHIESDCEITVPTNIFDLDTSGFHWTASLSRIEEDPRDGDDSEDLEFSLDSIRPRSTVGEGDYSSENVFKRLEKDTRKALSASQSMEIEELQDGNCMSNSILRGIIAYVDFQCCMESAKTVKSKLRRMGAVVLRRMSLNVSHVIFSRGGRKSTLQAVLSMEKKPYLLDPHWVHSCYFNQLRAPEESYNLYGCKYLVDSIRRVSSACREQDEEEESLEIVELSPEDDLDPRKGHSTAFPRSSSVISISDGGDITFDKPMSATQLLSKIDILSKRLDRLANEDTAALTHGKRCPSREASFEPRSGIKSTGINTAQFVPKNTVPLRRRTHGAFSLHHRAPFSAAVKEMATNREEINAERGIRDVTNLLSTIAISNNQNKVSGIDDMRRTQPKTLTQIHKTLQNNSKYRKGRKAAKKVAPIPPAALPSISESFDESESILRTPRTPTARPTINTASNIINQLQNVPSSEEFASNKKSRISKQGVIFTGFNRRDEAVLKEVAVIFKLKVQRRIDKTTRCIVSQKGQRTLTTLRAVCSGIPIVKADWLSMCEREDKLVGLKKYAYPQWQRVLQPRKSTLFRRLGDIFIVDGCSPPTDDLKWMVKKCGGQLASCADDADLIISPSDKEVHIPWSARRSPPMVVGERYILDSITEGSLMTVADYADVSVSVVD